MKPKDKPVTKRDPGNLTVMCKKDETDEHAMARVVISPTVQAGITLRELNKGGFKDVELMSLIENLKAQNDTVKDGNLARSEEMLMSQAHTLDSLFHALTRRSMLNMGEYVNAAETYMRLALKAQSQCRTTLEALSEIKIPPIFAKQANIAHNQQVNNGVPVADSSRARENKNPPNKLLEQNNGKRLDTRTTCTTGTTYQDVETVGEINRPKNS